MRLYKLPLHSLIALLSINITCGCSPDKEPAEEWVIDAAEHASQSVTAERIIHADAEPGNWLSTGRTYDEQRFSPLAG